ncbi:MAG: hypothetical protein E7519_10990 [Ruminococcaceae bacterium]|nr:hypothetical protein [Oscillospiraceae bacterium]
MSNRLPAVEHGKFFPGAFDRPNRKTGKTTLSTQKQKAAGTRQALSLLLFKHPVITGWFSSPHSPDFVLRALAYTPRY